MVKHKMGDTGSTGPVYITTIDDLLASHTALLYTESVDRAALGPIMSPATTNIQSSLLQWASAGFPHDYGVLGATLSLPPTCSDGVSRNLLGYIWFLTGSEIMTLASNFQNYYQGMLFSYTLNGNSVSIVVSKAPA
jgi:hypothetical protein